MSEKSGMSSRTDSRTAALERAYLAHKDRLLTLAAAIVGGRQAAEDVVHDVFARLAAGGHDPSGNGIARFLTVCARNAAISTLRSRKVASEHAGMVVASGSSQNGDPLETAERAEEAEAVIRHVGGLPEDEREALALRVWGEMSFEEIAELQGVAKATAHARYRSALEILRKCMM